MFNLNIFEREDLSPIRKLLMLHAIAGGAAMNEYEIEGNPAVFQTNVQKALAGFTIPFYPVQSGSGDPSPDNVRPISGWSGVTAWRGGKNLFDQEKYSVSSGYPNSYNNYNYSDIVKLKPNTTYIFKSNATQPISSGRYYVIFVNTGSDPESFDNKTYVYPVYNGSFSGTGVTNVFTTGETGAVRFGYPGGTNVAEIMSVDWQLEIGDTQTDYTPFAAIDSYPVTFPALGKNLLNNQAVSDTVNDVVFTVNADKSITAVGEASASLTFELGSMELKAGTYILSGGLSNGAYINIPGKVNAKASEASFTISGESETIAPRIYIAGGENVNGTFNPMIRKSTEQSAAYEPYTNTVYGGTVYPLDGRMLVELVGIAKKWSDFAGKTDLGNNIRGYVNIASNPSISGDSREICNMAKRSYNYSSDSVHFYTNGNSAFVFLPEDTDEDTEIQIVYPLATPYEIPLDPITVQTLIGDNTIWTDTNGENTIRYKKKG